MDDYLLNYSGNDICSGKFVYSEFLLSKKRIQSVVVAEIYNPSSFYLQISQSIENLNNFMDSLQLFYDNNGDKYKVLPELIIPGLACAACFEESQRWHRAIVMNVIDEHNVKLLYVDYGSIEVTSKSKVRLLEKRYGVLPVQALHCSLFQTIETIKYPREINEKFAMMIDNRILEAEFHDLITEDTIPKRIVTLYVKQANYKIDIKSECSKEMLSFKNGNGESIRRLICKVIGDSTDDEYYAEIDEH